MESFFGTIDYLNRNIDYKSLLNDKAVRKIAGAGDPVNTLAQDQGGWWCKFCRQSSKPEQIQAGLNQCLSERAFDDANAE